MERWWILWLTFFGAFSIFQLGWTLEILTGESVSRFRFCAYQQIHLAFVP